MRESLNSSEGYQTRTVEEDLGAIAGATSIELSSDFGGDSTELVFNSAVA